MLKPKQKKQKIFSIIGIFGLLFMEMFPLAASAADFTIPDSLMDLISSTDTDIKSATNILNSSDNDPSGLLNKQQGPKVDVTFTSQGAMQSGAKMTATAIPSFFDDASNPKNLYFTWYLKRSGCELTNDKYPTGKKRNEETDKMESIAEDEDQAKISACDLDGDKTITVNDWKIAAAKIIVKGTFDANETDGDGKNIVKYDQNDYSEDLEKNSGYEAVPSPVDDWEINSGKDHNDPETASNCYVQEPKSGLIYEMRQVKDVFSDCPDIGGVAYERACIDKMTTSCNVLNSVYKNAVIAGSPFPIPMPVKNVIGTGDVCGVSTKNSGNFDCSVADLTNFKSQVSCNEDKGISMCVPKGNADISIMDNSDKATKATGKIYGEGKFNDPDNINGVCGDIFNQNTYTVGNPIVNPMDALIPLPNFLDTIKTAFVDSNKDCTALKDALVDGTKNVDESIAVKGNIKYEPICSFEKSDNMCKHLFPEFPKDKVTINGAEINMDGAVTGDSKFTINEKQFWGADPTSEKTNGIQKDEEAVTGLGIDKFSWMFSSGDQVGVVVEGEAELASEHKDSSHKIMWAFSGNKCKKLEKLGEETNKIGEDSDKYNRGFYLEGSEKTKAGFLTAEFDLNECLEENLLDPDVNDVSKLTVQLNVSPENPINDASGKGDILSINSTPINTKNSSGLLYNWSVQKSRDGSNAPIDTTSWVDVTSAMESGGSFSAVDIMGLNKKDLAINLNMQSSLIEDGMNKDMYNGSVFYLRIKVKIRGTAADGSQNAEGMEIVRINQQQNEMLAYPVTATSAGMVSLNKGIDSEPLEICSDTQGKKRCYVAKNQIIGLEVPNVGNNKLSNFSWFVNGNPMLCKESISSQCTVGGNKLFVPVLGSEGEAVDVVAKALNEKNESIEVSRHFVISQSALQITSLDPSSFCGVQCLENSSVCPKYLGFYKDLAGNQYPDCSTEVWETTEGKTVTLGATGQTGFDWAVDGQIFSEYKDQNQIQLTIDKAAGESYNIGLSTHLLVDNTKQLSSMRLALYRNWGVAPEEVVEENQSANIQLDVIAGSGQIVATSKSNFFGASLITHLPEQLMFLLKISLTSILLLMATGLLFAFIPETLFREKE